MVPLADITWKDTEAGCRWPEPTERTYDARGRTVQDSTPRVISNLVSDQSECNAAALQASGVSTAPDPATCDDTSSVPVPNQVPNNVLAAPFSSMFTLFGQFFDHGLDLVGKSGTEAVVVPLQPDDPLYQQGSGDQLHHRQPDDPGWRISRRSTPRPRGSTRTRPTPRLPRKQVFLREYVADGAGKPQSNGRLLDGVGGNIGNWAEIKAQAASLLGIQLVDTDILNVPLLLTDEYGRFLRGRQRLPADGDHRRHRVEGNPAAPITTAGAGRSTGHAFLDDIAHDAVPGTKDPDGDPDVNAIDVARPAGTYDDELLDAHFITGDGRGNENIGLTAIHTMFHSEHNRLADDIDACSRRPAARSRPASRPQAAGAIRSACSRPPGSSTRWSTSTRCSRSSPASSPRRSPRSRRTTRSSSRTSRPSSPMPSTASGTRCSPRRSTASSANGDANGHRAHRCLPQPDGVQRNGGALTAEQAAGDIVRGMSKQTGNEIDEFVTGALRNSLLGLPLDLATLNIVRGRDTGTPRSMRLARRSGLLRTPAGPSSVRTCAIRAPW